MNSPALEVLDAPGTASRYATTHGYIEARNISIHLGSGGKTFEAVKDLSLSLRGGEFTCVLGPSGCGKSTLLGAIAGHLTVQGDLLLDGLPITGPDQDRGLVFQQHSLFPWLSVLGNVAFGPKMRGIPRKQRDQNALRLIQQVGLEGFSGYFPSQLSGGMQQRAEIARVLINQPRVVLMDEPFGSLDAQCRIKMQKVLLEVWTQIRTTVVFVTHDIDEALFLADRIVIMSGRPGRVLDDISLDFARPRDEGLMTSPHFLAIKRHCLNILHQ